MGRTRIRGALVGPAAAAAGLACAALLSAGISGCGNAEAQQNGKAEASKKSTPPEAAAVRVEVAEIAASTAGLSLKLPGEVEGARDALLATPMGGYVEAVHIENGERVRKGQVLANVDTATHSAARAQAEVELKTAEREFKRAKALGDAIASAEIDAAESRLLAAKAAVWTAQVQASRTVITAPFAGVVADLDIEVGEVAAPGVPLVRLVQLDPALVSVSLSDRDVVAVSEGMDARVRPDARAELLAGKIKHLQPAADIRTRTFIAEIEVPNEDKKLLPGMIVSVELDAPVAENQMVISQDWLVTRIDDIGVYVEVDGKAQWRQVSLGPVVRKTVVIEEGLTAGDALVITGHRDLADGDPMLVTRRGKCCTQGRVVFPDASAKSAGSKQEATPPNDKAKPDGEAEAK